jgi:hypothetical protein
VPIRELRDDALQIALAYRDEQHRAGSDHMIDKQNGWRLLRNDLAQEPLPLKQGYIPHRAGRATAGRNVVVLRRLASLQIVEVRRAVWPQRDNLAVKDRLTHRQYGPDPCRSSRE